MWIPKNNNPCGRNTGDCAIRAVAIALDITWEQSFLLIAKNAFEMCDVLASDATWGSVLRQHGFYRYIIPNSYPENYTVKDFCKDNPEGIFVLGTGNHAVAVIDGDYYDSWDSGQQRPVFYWSQEVEDGNLQ